MNEQDAIRLLHRVDRVGVGPAPIPAIVRAGAQRRRRRRRLTLIAAAVVVVAGVAGVAAIFVFSGEVHRPQPAAAPSDIRELVQGTWTPETVFGRDVRGFRTSDGTPAVVTFGPQFVDATEDSVNDSGARYRIERDGNFTTYQWATSTVGCLSVDRRRCPTIRTSEALRRATKLRLVGDRMTFTDETGDAIAVLTRSPAHTG